MNAPDKVRSFVNSLPDNSLELIELSDEVLDLVDLYIKENVVGKTRMEDCIHIAIATICRADVLVSWNFKHIVNLNKIHGYNFVNSKVGYTAIEIRSPFDLIDYVDKN